MSISEITSDSYSNVDEKEGPLSPSNMPIGQWFAVWLRTTFLLPSKYALRSVEDKGSIYDSLTAAGIDIFDRSLAAAENPFIKTAKVVGVYALCAFIPLMSVLGAAHQGTLAAKYLFKWVDEGRETRHWDKFTFHLTNLSYELLIGGLWICFGGPIVSFGFLVASISTSLIFGTIVTLAHPSFFSRYMPSKEDENGLHNSLMLRNEFGIVGKNGHLLSWGNQDIDVEEVSLSVSLKKGVINSYQIKLSGYFGKLYLEQGHEFLDLLLALKKQLPPDLELSFSYPPSAQQVIEFLEENEMNVGLDASSIFEWKKAFSDLEERMSITREIIKKGYSLYNPYEDIPLILDFPLDEATCRSYLDKNH